MSDDMKIKKTATMLFVLTLTIPVFGYVKAKVPLMTEWGEAVTVQNAWRSYPRPQMVRKNWNIWGWTLGNVNRAGTATVPSVSLIERQGMRL